MSQYTYRGEWWPEHFIAEPAAGGEEVPPPLAERQYSGRFVVRTSPALRAARR
jgi:HicB family